MNNTQGWGFSLSRRTSHLLNGSRSFRRNWVGPNSDHWALVLFSESAPFGTTDHFLANTNNGTSIFQFVSTSPNGFHLYSISRPLNCPALVDKCLFGRRYACKSLSSSLWEMIFWIFIEVLSPYLIEISISSSCFLKFRGHLWPTFWLSNWRKKGNRVESREWPSDVFGLPDLSNSGGGGGDARPLFQAPEGMNWNFMQISLGKIHPPTHIPKGCQKKE